MFKKETKCGWCEKPMSKCECNTTLDPWESLTGDTDTEYDDFHDTVTAMRNRIDVLLELNQHEDLSYAIPTILEDLYENCQRLLEDYCFEE